MSSEIRDGSGQLLGRIDDLDGTAVIPKLIKKREGSLLRKWVGRVLPTRADEIKYKQVSAKGYRLK